MNLDKLKESARKYEQSGQWRPAIDVYKKALREFEESGEGVPDPSLYNRIGDLEMKAGESGAAIRAYEQAADLYTEQGFFNNAIALCGKILRINAGRAATYLRLAQLNARKNFVGEAKKTLAEYLERMTGLHHREEALGAVRLFADQFRGNPDIRDMLIELLRELAPDAHGEGLGLLAEELESGGDAVGARRSRERLTAGEGPAATSATAGSDLVFLDVGVPGLGAGRTGGAVVEGLDSGRAEPELDWRRDTGVVDGLELTAAAEADPDAMPEILADTGFEADDLETAAEGMDIDVYPEVEGERSVDGLALVDPRLQAGRGPGHPPVADTYETLDEAARADVGEAGGAELEFLAVEEAGEEPRGEETAEPDEGELARARARLQLQLGDFTGAIAALEEALARFEASSRLEEALEAADELTRLEPNAVFRFQKRVELAYRSGRRDLMLDSYLRLADALERGGGVEHARTVYRRVLEHDPGNVQATAALVRLTAPPPPPRSREAFVDLGSLIMDEPPVRDTRIRVDQQAPIEDEDQAFLEALAQFKRGIEENLDAEDFQAHYDLGIAFKEMGLLDEAIAQFQKALRAPEGRLKTSEQLGIAFYEKERFAIAEAVLRRAIDSLPGGDEEKIGLIYWLGRAVEAQRRQQEAIRCFERVLAVDIRFLDVGERVHRLAAEPQ